MSKQIFEVMLNDRTKILVKAEQEKLEQLVKENKIYEYVFVKIHTLNTI